MNGKPTAKGALVVQGSGHSCVFMCPHCKYTTEKKANWYKHTKTHIDKKAHICEICSYACKTASNMKRHMLTHDGVKQYTCEFCHKCFNQKHNLLRHIKTQHQQKRVICATCGEFFKDEDKLSGHMMQKHKGFPGEQVSSNKAGQPMITCNTETYKCSSCPEILMDRKSLQQHVKIHGKGAELKYFCDMCCFVSDTVSKLKRHKLTHSKLKPYICALCGYRSNQKDHILRHMKAKHPGTNDRATHVQLCHKPYLQLERPSTNPDTQLKPCQSHSPQLEKFSNDKLIHSCQNHKPSQQKMDKHNDKAMPQMKVHNSASVSNTLSSCSQSAGKSAVKNNLYVEAISSSKESENEWLNPTVTDLMFALSENTANSLPCILLPEGTDFSNTNFVIVKEINSPSMPEETESTFPAVITGNTGVFGQNKQIELSTKISNEGADGASGSSDCMCYVNTGDSDKFGEMDVFGKDMAYGSLGENLKENKADGDGSGHAERVFSCHFERDQRNEVVGGNASSKSNQLNCVVDNGSTSTNNANSVSQMLSKAVENDALSREVSPEGRKMSAPENISTEPAVEVYMMNKDTLLVQDTENPYVFYHVHEQQEVQSNSSAKDIGSVNDSEATKDGEINGKSRVMGQKFGVNKQNTSFHQSGLVWEEEDERYRRDSGDRETKTSSKVLENETETAPCNGITQLSMSKCGTASVSQTRMFGERTLLNDSISPIKNKTIQLDVSENGTVPREASTKDPISQSESKNIFCNDMEDNTEPKALQSESKSILRYKKQDKSCQKESFKNKNTNWRQGDKSFTCTFCKMAFCKAISLYKHVHEQHNTQVETRDTIKWKCMVCRYTCKQRNTLLRHMRTHKTDHSSNT